MKYLVSKQFTVIQYVEVDAESPELAVQEADKYFGIEGKARELILEPVDDADFEPLITQVFEIDDDDEAGDDPVLEIDH